MLTTEEATIVREYLANAGENYHFAGPHDRGLRCGQDFSAYEVGIIVGEEFIGWSSLDREGFEALVGDGEEADFDLLDQNLIEERGEKLLAAIKAEE